MKCLTLLTTLLALTACAAGVSAQPAAGSKPVSKVLITGETIAINGVDTVPRGLFGVHWTDLDPQMIQDWGIECARQMHGAPAGDPTIPSQREDWRGLSVTIDCLGDRYHPATVLTNRNYEQYFTQLGTSFARNAKANDWPAIAEFWNEIFLNWSYKPGVNYDPQFYETKDRRIGAPMTIKGWDKPLDYLVWNKAIRSVHANGRSDLMSYLAYNYIGRHHPAGHEFEFRGGKYRNQEMWWGRDPSQVSYWSGKQNAQFYIWMLVPFAKAVKQENPSVQVVAGAAFHPSAHDWQAWEILYKPVIDAAWQWIDGINEHHYHGDSRRVAVEYEVACAYGMAKYGKFLKGYNTECGGRADSNLPGAPDNVADDALKTAIGAYAYGMRDITYMLHTQPDKAATRTSHGANKQGWGLGGDEFVFRMFKPLRGRLIRTECEDRSVWPIASLNDQGELIVLLFNDHRQQRTIAATVRAPVGTKIALKQKMSVRVDAEAGRLAMQPEKVALEEGHDVIALAQRVPGRSAVRLTFDVHGKVQPGPRIERRQFVAPDILYHVNPDEFLFVDIKLDQATLDHATAAWLRLALTPHNSKAQWRIEGRTKLQPLPDFTGIAMIPLDVNDLAATTRIAFLAGAEKADGLRLPAVSIVLDTPGN